ncbi:hypothetical protein HZB02_04095 [Candidatus Woesearchaeota archaeon]|nr:hypothetical protein [Candidatus Woesearchaeota archaeon]
MNNKGSILADMTQFIPRFIFLVIAVVCLVVFIKGFIVVNVNVQDAEEMVLTNRLLFSPTAISYEDEFRSYPGTIDLPRFTSEHLEKSTSYTNSNTFAMKLELLKTNGKDPYPNSNTAYLHQTTYDKLEPLARTKLPGSGSAKLYERRMYVTVKGENRYQQAVLKITTVIANS